jgi:hypothetical protein
MSGQLAALAELAGFPHPSCRICLVIIIDHGRLAKAPVPGLRDR